MKISDLIERLGELQAKHGDIPCGIFEDGGPWAEFKTVTVIPAVYGTNQYYVEIAT